jgi:hypothetical protein
MLTGRPHSATLTTTQKGDPVIYVSVKSDADGYVYGSNYGLSSDGARELTKKVLAYMGYDASSDKDQSKIVSGDCVDVSKSIEFDLKETIGADGKTYKNLVFPTLNSVSGKPKNMLTKESAAMIVATHNLKEFFSGIKSSGQSEEIPF